MALKNENHKIIAYLIDYKGFIVFFHLFRQ